MIDINDFGNKIEDCLVAILYDLDVEVTSIHHIELVYSSPDTWFKIVHKCGDEIKQNWFEKLFKLKQRKYKKTLVYDKYASKLKSLDDVVSNIDAKHYYKPDENEYPIWFNRGFHVFIKDEYGNPKNCSHIYYTNKFDLETMWSFINSFNKNIIKKIKNEKEKAKEST